MTHPSEDGLADSVPTVPVVPGAAGDEAAAAEAAGAPPQLSAHTGGPEAGHTLYYQQYYQQ